MRKGGEEGWLELMSVLAKAVECGEWERDAWVVEASIGCSGRQARTLEFGREVTDQHQP
jgi:hypothetical protein